MNALDAGVQARPGIGLPFTPQLLKISAKAIGLRVIRAG